MKKRYLLTAYMALLTGFSLFGQDNVQQNDAEISKALVTETYARANALVSKGQVEEAAAYIKDNMAKCVGLKSEGLCTAGLNFTTAYVYQQAAAQDQANSEKYESLAIQYYESVLESYPENEAAWTNLTKLKEKQQTTVSNTTIERLQAMAEKNPADRTKIFVRIGDLLSKDKNSQDRACEFYGKAYEQDPLSEKACGAIVKMYVRNDRVCSSEDSYIRDFAYGCQNKEYPDYAEALLKHETSVHFQNKKYNEALKSVMLWTDIIAQNGWLSVKKVDRLKNKLFKGEPIPNDRNAIRISKALDALKDIAASDTYNSLDHTNFWVTSSPSIYTKDNPRGVYPAGILAKILYAKGKKAYYKKDIKTAEAYWQVGSKYALDFNKPYFAVIAADMAKMYNKHPELDSDNKKFNALVVRLFRMKGDAYKGNDLRMIRRYHITLGSIYYDKGVWDGSGYTNAEFQLRNALHRRLGPIVNPELRSMLGDVYVKLNNKSQAIQVYKQAAIDYMSLDKLKDAEKFIKRININHKATMSSRQSASFSSLQKLLDWRKESANPLNKLSIKEVSVNNYVTQVKQLEEEALKNLPSKFVYEQSFKGLTDTGRLLSDDRTYDKQLLYSNALIKIDGLEQLPSPNDYRRINSIKGGLETSVDQPKTIGNTRMQKNLSPTRSNGWGQPKDDQFKHYQIPSLNQEILVPAKLFELNGTINKDLQQNQIPINQKYQLQKGKVQLKKIGG